MLTSAIIAIYDESFLPLNSASKSVHLTWTPNKKKKIKITSKLYTFTGNED